jgi:hypothetical protein
MIGSGGTECDTPLFTVCPGGEEERISERKYRLKLHEGRIDVLHLEPGKGMGIVGGS